MRYFDYLFELDSAAQDQISPLARLDQKTVVSELSAGLAVTRLHHGARQILLLRSEGAVGLSKGGLRHGEELLPSGRRARTRGGERSQAG